MMASPTGNSVSLKRRSGAYSSMSWVVRLLICYCTITDCPGALAAKFAQPGANRHHHWGALAWRGGAARKPPTSAVDAYSLLAKAIQPQLSSPEDGSLPEISKIVKALKSLSASQKAFKGLDGAAHEAYQRTHTTDDVDISVSGRAKRSAARTGAAADGLGACEFCELMENPRLFDFDSPNGTLAGRQILLNITGAAELGPTDASVSLLALYEPEYQGGSGIHHGGIEDLTDEQRRRRGAKGRLVIVVGDTASRRLDQTFSILEGKPLHVRLHRGPEVASVQSSLYKAAGSLLTALEPLIRSHNASAVHFVGRSLSGGIASIASAILDGELPMPGQTKAPRRKRKRKHVTTATEKESSSSLSVNITSHVERSSNTTIPATLQGLARGRVSTITLGAPPCMSANVQTDFVTSVLFGDDIVCRITPESLDRFLGRTRRALKRGGIIGKRINWMSDTMSLAKSSLQSHAVGSEGEEARLATPGQAYLVRPRRLGQICSMHEVGAQLKGGREALRAAVLWQLNDVLMSRSMWKHHQLDSYIHGLDRVHLRGIDDTDDV